MTKIFKAAERRFEENAGRIDGFRLMSDMAIAESGLKPETLNFDVRRLDPGELSSLYHFHRHAEELFMIISGTATLRTPDGLQVLEAGDIAFFGTGEGGAHQMYNHTGKPCIYLDIRTFAGCDIAEYPDSGRLLVIPTMEQFYKSSRTGYFDGESAEAAVGHFKNTK